MKLEQVALDQAKKGIKPQKMSASEKQQAEQMGQVAEVTKKAVENPLAQKTLNALVEKADNSTIMQGIRKTWDILPGWLQKGYIDPKTRGILNVSFWWTGLNLGAEGFDTLVKVGLLKVKKDTSKSEHDINAMLAEERKIEGVVKDVANVSTMGEGGELIQAIVDLKNSGRELAAGSRKHLDKVHAERDRQQHFDVLKAEDKAVSGKKISNLRKGINKANGIKG